MTQVTKARELALMKHQGQLYGEHPYMFHLYQVENIAVRTYGCGTDCIDELRAACLLHDILEDTNTTTDELFSLGFSHQVVNAISLVTKDEFTRYEQYINNIRMDDLALKVKLCDTAANLMNSINSCSAKRINKYSKQIQLLGGF